MQADIVGAGGIGIALAYALDDAGVGVQLIEQNAAKIRSGLQQGVRINGQAPKRLPLIAFEHWRPQKASFVLLCTKTYSNPPVLERLHQHHHSSMRLVPVQNGYDDSLEAYDHAGEAIASFVSQCESDTPSTSITRPGELHIGSRRALTASERRHYNQTVGALAEALAGTTLFKVRQVTDIRPYKATKLMYNAAISPLAASAGLDNAELLSNSRAKRYFFRLLLENHAILRNAGMPLARIGPFHPDTVEKILRVPGLATLMGRFFKPSLRGTYCSMAPDIGRKHTEIDAYNGYLIKLADNYPCPLNRAAVRLIKQMSQRQQRPHIDYLNTYRELLGEAA